jgi:hypothetical protein
MLNATQTRRTVARSIIDAAGSRFVTVDFVKKDGTHRTMNIQPEALKTHLAENPDPVRVQAARTRAQNHPNLMPVWDVQARAVRSINLDTVLAIKVDGTRYDLTSYGV